MEKLEEGVALSYIEQVSDEVVFRLEEFISRKISDARMILALPEGVKKLVWLRPQTQEIVFFGLPALFVTPTCAKTLLSNTDVCVMKNLLFPLVEEHYLYAIMFPISGSKKNGVTVLDVLTPGLHNANFLTKARKLLPWLEKKISNDWMFGLPIIRDNFSDLLQTIESDSLPYKVISIKFCNKTPNYYWMKYFPPGKKYKGIAQETRLDKNQQHEYRQRQQQHHQQQYQRQLPKRETFEIISQGTPDTYLIQKLGEYLLVNDLKTSQFMNQMFHQVGERHNLECEWVPEVRKWRVFTEGKN